jgi:hypothetical protein
VTPGQVQDITQLAEFMQKNPAPVIEAVKHRLKNKQYGEVCFLCYSAIQSSPLQLNVLVLEFISPFHRSV